MNRMIPDFAKDERINMLSPLAEIFFRRLWNKADDFGRYDARPLILKAELFPLRDIRVPDISRVLLECEKAALIVRYKVDGTGEFLYLPEFNQRVRVAKSKYPAPTDGVQMSDACQTNDGQMSDRCPLEVEEEKEGEKGGGKPAPFDFFSILSFGKSEMFVKAWSDWEQYRRERKLAKWTETTLRTKAKTFEQWGEAKTIESIQASISNGWQGLFEPNPTGNNGGGKGLDLQTFRIAYRKFWENDFEVDFCEERAKHIAVLKADLDTLQKTYSAEYEDIKQRLNEPFSKLKAYVNKVLNKEAK